MSGFYNFQKVAERFYHITSKENTNCQLVVGDKKALLFDTGYGIGDLKEAIREYTDLPIVVVNSHGHLDHINGNHHFEGPVYIHPADVELANAHSMAECRKGNIENAKHIMDFLTQQVENIVPENMDEEAYINAQMPQWQFVEEGHQFDLGGVVLEVVHLPGHTRGSIGLWDAASKIFLIGDAFGPFTWLFAPEASNLSEYKKTLYKTRDLQPVSMLAGHALEPVTLTQLEWYIDCAEHVDYSKGVPFENPIFPDLEAKVCVREGYAPMEFHREGYASVVLGEGHLD